MGVYDETTTKKVELDKLQEENRRLKDVPIVSNSKASLERLYAPILSAYFLKAPTQTPSIDTINAVLFEVEKLLTS